MLKSVCITVLSLLLLAYAISASAQDKTNEIDVLVQSFYESGEFNGVALIAENGNIILNKGYGYSNREWNNSNDPETKFKIGSMNKQFFAMAIMKLVEEGKVKLDGKISEYLPDFRKDVGDKVTVHHLLTHSSGMPRLIDYNSFARIPSSLDQAIEYVSSGD